MKYQQNYGRQGNLMASFFDYTILNKQNSTEKWKKGNLRITKNYRGIILTTIMAKVYNALLLNHVQGKSKSEQFSQKSINNFFDSNYLLNH